METLYIVIGAFSSILIFLLGYSVSGVFNGKKRLDYVESFVEDTERMVYKLDRDINHRVDKDIEDTHQTFRDVETDLRSQLKSRMDKLTNQIIKKIPPTNDTIIKEVQKMRDDFFALRQNF